MQAMAPARIESAPSSAPTERSSTTFSGAGRAPARSSTDSSLADLDREAAGDDARAAEDRLADAGRGDHLVVEHDRERLADILLGDPAELARARHCRSRKLTTGWLSWNEGWASVRFSPLSSTWRLTT